MFTTSNLCAYAQGLVAGISRSRPNVLLIVVDDLRPELGMYGEPQIVSPNIDRLAERGQLFTHTYANFPSCAPSRIALLSGLYDSRNRFKYWNSSQDHDVPGLVSLPMHFRNNGYKTISLGKVYNNFGDGKGSWDEEWRPPTTTTRGGWDYQTENGIEIFRKVNSQREKSLKIRNKNNLPRKSLPFEKADVSDVTYKDGKTASKAIEELESLKQSSQPFFLAIGFKKPHLPFNAPRRYWKLYDQPDIKLPENSFKPKGAPDISVTTNSGELRAFYGVPNQGPIPDSLARQLIQGYDACVSFMDKQVGRVLNELELLGLDNDTIVVLTADHGFQLGEHGLWGKHTNYLVSLHIPLIIRVPGKQTNVRQNDLISQVDIYPTLCDLAGLSKPFHLQGKSFAGQINNPKLDGRKEVYYHFRGAETIITKTHSYTEFFNQKGKQIANMLYDLRDDPGENTNIAKKAANKQLIKKLGDQLSVHMKNRDNISLK